VGCVLLFGGKRFLCKGKRRVIGRIFVARVTTFFEEAGMMRSGEI